MNKKKELIILGIVTLVLLVTLGVTYAIFTFSKTSVKSELIAGDIYMKYKETKGISLSNAMPRETYDPNGYFEFTIEGKNTYTEKDIIYDVVLNHGDEPSDANRTIRIEDKYLHFRLVEVVNNEEQEIFTNEKYNNIQNKRIYVNTISKNTTNNISHIYRLYMWIGSEVGIGNTSSANYSVEDWNKVYASVKVNVTGDFNEKYTTTPPYCFTTTDNGDNTVTINGIIKDEYEINDNMTDEELQNCKNYILNQGYPSYATSICDEDQSEFPWMLENGYLSAVDLQFFLDNNIAVVSNAIPEMCTEKNIIIPQKIDNKIVISIASTALSNIMLNSVEIPNTITTIGEKAFYNNNLTSVVIPDSVTTIGGKAFSNNQLTSVVIPNSVTTIEYSAFEGNKLTSVEIPNSVTTIGDWAFLGNQLTSVEIPNSVTTIGDKAFYRNQLTNVVIPNSVTTIGDSAFLNNQLTSVSIGNSVTTIGNHAFAYNQLTSVSIGNSVTTIGNYAFTNNQLTSVDIPNSVTTIGPEAFAYNQLTSVSIGNGITSIGKNAFIKVSNSNPNLSSITIDKSCNDIKYNLLSGSTNYYPWLSSPYTASGVTIYGSGNTVCDSFN